MEYIRALIDNERAAAMDDLSSDPSLPVPFIASTAGVKADGISLELQDWDLRRFREYPVILYGHDYMGTNLPIGRGHPNLDDDALRIDVQFDTEDEFAMRVRGKVLRGMMAGSVGWRTEIRGENTRNELIEFSMVPVPMDPDSRPEIERQVEMLNIRRELDDLKQQVNTGRMLEPVEPELLEVLSEPGEGDELLMQVLRSNSDLAQSVKDLAASTAEVQAMLADLVNQEARIEDDPDPLAGEKQFLALFNETEE